MGSTNFSSSAALFLAGAEGGGDRLAAGSAELDAVVGAAGVLVAAKAVGIETAEPIQARADSIRIERVFMGLSKLGVHQATFV